MVRRPLARRWRRAPTRGIQAAEVRRDERQRTCRLQSGVRRRRTSATPARCRRMRAEPRARRNSSWRRTGASEASRRARARADGVLNVTINIFFTPVRNGATAFGPEDQVRPPRRPLVRGRSDGCDSGPHRHCVEQRVVDFEHDALELLLVRQHRFSRRHELRGRFADLRPRPVRALHRHRSSSAIRKRDAISGRPGFVVRKTSVIDFATIAVTAFHNLTGYAAGAGPFAPVGVDNEDAGRSAPASSSASTTRRFGTLMLRRVSNPGGTPTISGNVAIAVSPTAAPITVRHLGNLGSTNGQIDGGDDRLTSASLVNGRLWTAHTIGVTDTGQADATADRNGVRWYEIGSLTATPGRHADRHGLLEQRVGELQSAQLLGPVDGDVDERTDDHRLQRRGHERVRQRWRRRAVFLRRRRHDARAAALDSFRGSLQSAWAIRARRLAAAVGVARHPRSSTAATARRFGRCRSSPTAINSYGAGCRPDCRTQERRRR